jgi:hypothetical protein
MEEQVMKKTFFCVAIMLAVGFGSLFAQVFSVSTYDDQASSKGTSTIKKVEAEETIGGRTVTTYSFSGKVTTKYQYGYAGVILYPDEPTKPMLAASKGVRFKVTGDGKRYRFAAETPGGQDNHYGKEFQATKKESTVTIEYRTMAQEQGWGAVKSFNATDISQLKIQTIGQPISSYKFKIYDIELIF